MAINASFSWENLSRVNGDQRRKPEGWRRRLIWNVSLWEEIDELNIRMVDLIHVLQSASDFVRWSWRRSFQGLNGVAEISYEFHLIYLFINLWVFVRENNSSSTHLGQSNCSFLSSTNPQIRFSTASSRHHCQRPERWFGDLSKRLKVNFNPAKIRGACCQWGWQGWRNQADRSIIDSSPRRLISACQVGVSRLLKLINKSSYY